MEINAIEIMVKGQICLSLVLAFLFCFPLWKIFQKTGRSPFESLLVFVPLFGPFIVAGILAFGKWPRKKYSRSR